MKTPTLVAIGLSVGLAGCLHGRPDPKDRYLCGPAPTQEEARAAAQTYANSALKDPFSAAIRNVRVVEEGSAYKGLANGGGYHYGWVITFEINAKNSYGGYVGFRSKEVLRTADGRVTWSPDIQ